MREYSTADVRRVFALAPDNLAGCEHTNPNPEVAEDIFNRWLQRIKAEAWDAAALYLGINEQEHLGEWLWSRNQFNEERNKP